MTEPAPEGLRARKRRATRDAIELNAVDLVIEHGYENVTVEMICEAATISQRTFFNYAGSKERAVLGIEPPLPSDRRRAAYVAGLGGSPLRDLLATMTGAFSDAGGGAGAHDLVRKRRRILEANPELAARELSRLEDAQQVIVGLIRERLAADMPRAEEADLVQRSGMLFSLAFGVLHHLAQEWLQHGMPADPQPSIDASLALVRELVAE
ncbi:TetR/AcrR family transcriptional regulator [Microbacterium sp. No. 7]|uniref:TetR/AcrR family transcriptional regulator n=1 Tax=Microbacterium sp. No. 7 TaxID=1714373 RepID=UPI0006D19D15|nr:TetR/AcrR family transcriptional regulator [Microbacterium sp. No. 7]ALJ19971.1 hypothetical protein AOA12_08635 [Microbacterium sp. No. 7]